MIKRLDGQELLDAQHAKIADPEDQSRWALRGQTMELGCACARQRCSLQRFRGRGLDCASGLLVLSQNLLRLDRLQRDAINSAMTATLKLHELPWEGRRWPEAG